uniref:HTH_48 domain-containing protein n=1 Tax=Heterorhabditis bacteriophora TaxID=37862 RepID=A0A1I7XHZ7_HETBA
MEKVQIRAIVLYEFKLGSKVVETACNINRAFGEGTVNERTAQFHIGKDSLKDKKGRGHCFTTDDNKLRTIIKANTPKTTREVAEELYIDQSTVFRHLYQIGKSKKPDKWVPHELNGYQK